MKSSRIDIGTIRREQIVEAASSVIAEQGIQNLSLSEIENKVEMSRGQLTYYFKTKEEILVAVFDKLLLMMNRQTGAEDAQCSAEHPYSKEPFIDAMRHLFEMVLGNPPHHPEFLALQYTFLSQISHREDFRLRLARLYEEWRSAMTKHLDREMSQSTPLSSISPRAVATLVQALLHGLAMQVAADPERVDIPEMIDLSLDMLESYLSQSSQHNGRKGKHKLDPANHPGPSPRGHS